MMPNGTGRGTPRARGRPGWAQRAYRDLGMRVKLSSCASVPLKRSVSTGESLYCCRGSAAPVAIMAEPEAC